MPRYFDHVATVRSRSGEHTLRLRLADRFSARLLGLMGAAPLAPQQGLLLSPCNSVHGVLLRQGLDVVFLGTMQQHGATRLYTVQHTAYLRPWGARAHWASRHTLELPVGSVAAMQLQPGDTVVVHPPGAHA